MNIIFMGTPDFAVPIFMSLAAAYTVKAALTQPDRPKGRGLAMNQSPVKQAALSAGVPVFQPETLRDKNVRRQLRAYHADIFVVAAYGLIIPPKVLAIPPLGCVNVHASLLPKYRGASPIQRCLMNGDTATGITIMYMDRGIDTGDIILQRELDIGDDEGFVSLHDRMADLGAGCILEALAQIENGTAARTPQDETLASYAPLIEKTDGLIDWQWNGERVTNRVRAMEPWPGAYTNFRGQTLKIWRTEKAAGLSEQPGTVLAVDEKRGLLVQAADSAVWLTELQAAGKKRMSGADFQRGQKIKIGEILG
jgi:methionyl-tRNA formyltransferase